MNKVAWWLSLTVVVTLLAGSPVARAEDDDHRMKERLERLEKHVQHLSSTPDRPMERFSKAMEARRQMHPPVMEAPKPPMPACPMQASCMKHLGCALRFLLLLAAIINIILAFWVYSDVRKRGKGRGIFIVLVLLAGLPAAILYALVRIGDRVGEKPS